MQLSVSIQSRPYQIQATFLHRTLGLPRVFFLKWSQQFKCHASLCINNGHPVYYVCKTLLKPAFSLNPKSPSPFYMYFPTFRREFHITHALGLFQILLPSDAQSTNYLRHTRALLLRFGPVPSHYMQDDPLEWLCHPNLGHPSCSLASNTCSTRCNFFKYDSGSQF